MLNKIFFVLSLIGLVLTSILVLEFDDIAPFFIKNDELDSKCSNCNIILIASDALRAQNVPCYGYNKDTAPVICSLAEEEGAFLFANAISQKPTTQPGVYSTMSGSFPYKIRNGDNAGDSVLLAEILKKEGYQTLGVVGTNMLSKGTGFERGFNLFIDVKDQKTSNDAASVAADELTKSAIKLLDKVQTDKPFFLWVFYKDTHAPYLPPKPYNSLFVDENEDKNSRLIKKEELLAKGTPKYALLGDEIPLSFYVSQYDGEIKFFDDNVKVLIDKLKELGVYNNSIIIITSDHGESLGEHDYYFDHGLKLDEQNIKVPLIIKFPDTVLNKKVNMLVTLSDIVPTILSYIGINQQIDFDGLDLTEYVLHDKSVQRNIFLQNDKPDLSSIGVTDGEWNFIYNLDNSSSELYHLSLDNGEKINLNEKNKELADKYKKLVLKNDKFSFLNDETRRETVERLKSLGYLGA